MVRSFALPVSLLTCAIVGPANADVLRDFCPDRPGKGTPPCILDTGHIQAEMSLFDLTHAQGADAASDTALIGDLLIRAGISKTTEIRIGWTPVGIVRSRDLITNIHSHIASTGDVSLGFRTNLKNPDGSGFSVAIQPSVSLPTGGNAIGSGTWGASLAVPMSVQMSKVIQLAFTPELDASPNSDGKSRHARYGGVIGIGMQLGTTVSGGVEIAAFRDEDPAGRSSAATLDMTLAWTPAAVKDFQIDAGLYAGLNRQTPGLQVALGIAKRF
jgi:hypothetical protein